ncbi:energy-coupling factor transporter transmembrane component T family protein [Myceligenerans pegani]|uniref:Energy-coupling factor transporter transmembrane protein EcfT n=1 Tax=Myceligenerans pegani TaxID=2776917 RepID=A0ABR9N474_9MICO|nr:CbiQ family ECF transporter T component [Myceligenerans sp. TRM 65318]MBE1878472.1 energy-coupling factor transporter transmembrane protein EcfT [Myceligenerans sp. TRM 65318]MBE3020743.1 energy-coupling factor transporter transmembrane protein EcfT [Myceligenerans sp. TRM 65318]
MITLYRPGDSLWHRLPTGRKAALLAALVLGISLVPVSWAWWGALIPAAVCLGCYAVPGIGVTRLLAQAWAARWIILVTLAGQLLFLGPQPAVVNTARVVAIIAVATLLALTTQVTELLDAIERGLAPLARLGVDPRRAGLLLTVTLTTLPVLARAAGHVREAQRARGARPRLRLFVVPFLVVALKHADELGEALTARGVR